MTITNADGVTIMGKDKTAMCKAVYVRAHQGQAVLQRKGKPRVAAFGSSVFALLHSCPEHMSISQKNSPTAFQSSPTGEMLPVWYLLGCDLLQKN